MIQNYQSLKFNIDEYSKSISSSQEKGRRLFGHIQKAFSSSHLICLVVRFPGVTKYLYLGRGNGYEGFWLGEKAPPSNLRVRDRFLEYIRKHVVGSKLESIKLDEQDRVVQISLRRKSSQGVFALFWKGRQSYFSYALDDQGKKSLFRSWVKAIKAIDSSEQLESSAMESFNEVGRRQIEVTKGEVSFDENLIENYFKTQSSRITLASGNKRKRKFFKRKIANIEKDLEKVKKWKAIKEEIESESMIFTEEPEQRIAGVLFKFPRKYSEYQRRDMVYGKIKSFKKAEELLNKRHQKSKNEFLEWENSLTNRDEGHPILGKIISPIWASSKEKVDPNKNEIELKNNNQIIEFNLKLENGQVIKGGIGKNTHANDFLRNKWASKENYWFHLENHRSGHLILKTDDINTFSNTDFEIIGSMLRDYANLELSEIPIVFTQVKNLKGLKGQPGAVLHKKGRFREVSYRNHWKEIISLR